MLVKLEAHQRPAINIDHKTYYIVGIGVKLPPRHYYYSWGNKKVLGGWVNETSLENKALILLRR